MNSCVGVEILISEKDAVRCRSEYYGCMKHYTMVSTIFKGVWIYVSILYPTR